MPVEQEETSNQAQARDTASCPGLLISSSLLPGVVLGSGFVAGEDLIDLLVRLLVHLDLQGVQRAFELLLLHGVPECREEGGFACAATANYNRPLHALLLFRKGLSVVGGHRRCAQPEREL